MKRLILSGLLGLSASAAYAEEDCPNPATVDSAYVPCVSAVDYGSGHYDPGRRGADSHTASQCYQYNRDGRTCGFVGYQERQSGFPWGTQSGRFECVNGCLKWAGQQ